MDKVRDEGRKGNVKRCKLVNNYYNYKLVYKHVVEGINVRTNKYYI